MAFTCSICGEESTRICVRCTKDACDNHLCDKCGRCSDCCECEVRLAEPMAAPPRAAAPADSGAAWPQPVPEASEPEADPSDPPSVGEDCEPAA